MAKYRMTRHVTEKALLPDDLASFHEAPLASVEVPLALSLFID